MSDAGGTDRLCKDFKMCIADPIDGEAIIKYVGRLAVSFLRLLPAPPSYTSIPYILPAPSERQEETRKVTRPCRCTAVIPTTSFSNLLVSPS